MGIGVDPHLVSLLTAQSRYSCLAGYPCPVLPGTSRILSSIYVLICPTSNHTQFHSNIRECHQTIFKRSSWGISIYVMSSPLCRRMGKLIRISVAFRAQGGHRNHNSILSFCLEGKGGSEVIKMIVCFQNFSRKSQGCWIELHENPGTGQRPLEEGVPFSNSLKSTVCAWGSLG